MSHYSIKLTIDGSEIGRIVERDMRLCIAFGVSSGNGSTQFNVVAASKSGRGLNAVNNFTWAENYKIAATRNRCENGMMISCGTEPKDVSPGQSYTLAENWTASVGNDLEAPRDGFRFVNQTREAAAVLWKDVEGRTVPVYVNRDGPFPQGAEDVVPKPGAVGVWFDRYADPGCVAEPAGLATFELSRDSPSLSVTYRDGRWQ